MNTRNLFRGLNDRKLMLTILLSILGIYLVFEIFSNFIIPKTFSVGLIISLLSTIILMLLILILFNKGGTFISHLLLLTFFSGNSIYILVNGINRYFTAFMNLQILFGLLVSLYALLVLFLNNHQLNSRIGSIGIRYSSYIILGLISVYLNEGFDRLLVYLILFGVILLSLNVKESLLLVAYIYIGRMLTNLSTLITGFTTLQFVDLLLLFTNLLISGAILFIIYITYFNKKYTNLENNNHHNNYYS